MSRYDFDSSDDHFDLYSTCLDKYSHFDTDSNRSDNNCLNSISLDKHSDSNSDLHPACLDEYSHFDGNSNCPDYSCFNACVYAIGID